jgi:drug/metabolite transporter (DMT)-like permease
MTQLNQTQGHARSHEFGAVFSLLFGALCWGVIWYPYRIMNEAGVPGIAASFYTYGLVIVLMGFCFIKSWRGIFKLPMSIVALCLVAGWTNIAYVLAVIDGEVMRVMLLFYLSPVWTLILAHFWLKEHTNQRGVMIILLALIGASIMLFDFSSQLQGVLSYLPLPRNQAEWIALSSGIGFSLTNVITRKSTHLSVKTKSFAVWVGVFVMTLVMMPFLNAPFPPPSFFSVTDWFVMLLIAFMLIAATMLVQYGVTKISATRASVLFLFELVVAAIASYYLAHETMEWNEWLGGALIMLAAFLSASQSSET